MGRRAFLGLAIGLFWAGADRVMAVERPSFTLELDAKPFQVRRYPAHLAATVEVSGSRDAAVNDGFRLLARYIFGGNQQGRQIAMTAPVLQTPQPATAGAATSATPVSNAIPTVWEVAFIMPSALTRAQLPAANDARIHIVDVPPSRVAVVTFSGFWSESNLRTHEQQLRDFLAARHLTTRQGPVYAFYDPPWTPWFLRTIEVQFRLDD